MALTPQQAEELQALVERRREALRTEFGQDLSRMREDRLDQVVGAVPDPGDESVAEPDPGPRPGRGVARPRRSCARSTPPRARMDEGSYGICTNCGQDIAFERLRANPGAERCIQCQTVFEKTHASQARTSL